MQMFCDLARGHLPLFSLNFGVITLIPKDQEANVIQQYRPICLLNVSFKIFTKVATNRLNSIADKVVSPSLTAFMRGRNILEGIVILHETFHEMHRKKQSGVILKLDFEKAYDKVRWPFLFQTLRMKGFSPRWISWVKTFISGGSVAVNVNDDVGHFFQTRKGLRQGDPLSPLLFNIIADMLRVFINRARMDGQLEGIVPHLVDEGLSILQYADDTILFLHHDLKKARNMKLLLYAFEQASGLKINFHKSELFCFGEAQTYFEHYADLFGCNAGSFPINYLDIPVDFRKLRNCDWKKVEEHFEKRLSSWRGKHLSIGGRLVLINSVLGSLPMYMMSFFSVPKGVLKKLEYFRSRFYWQGDDHKKKYRLAKWGILFQPKDQGGLGIQDLNTKNIALLSKWLYKLLTSDGQWQQILRNKYLGSKPLVQVERKTGDSHFWSCLMRVKHDFLRFGSFLVKDGSQIRFWEDNWLGGTPLKDQFLSLYNIVRPKFNTISDVLGSSPPNLSWRRSLYGPILVAWHELHARIEDIVLSQDKDEFFWNLTPNGQFSVKSLYSALLHPGSPTVNRNLWKLKAPLKVKIFLWYLRRGVVLTKDNLAKRNWKGSLTCVF